MRRIPSWLILILLFMLVYGFGIVGLKGEQSLPDFLKSPDLADQMYSILQLFVLEGRAVTDLPAGTAAAPLPLWIASYAAPVVTIFAFLQLVWRDISGAVSGLFHRYIYREHIVVVGFGWRGQKFTASALDLGKRVAAIDTQDSSRPIDASGAHRFRFFMGDVCSNDVLRRAGAQRASEIVIFCGDEFENIALARQVSQLVGRYVSEPERHPRIICHANSSVQRDQLIADQSQGGLEAPVVEFYSPEEAAARQCVKYYPPARYAKLRGLHAPHIMIFGDGPMLRELVRHLTLASQGPEPIRPRFTLLSEKTQETDPFLQAASQVCDLEVVQVDFRNIPSWKDLVLNASEPVSQYIIGSSTGLDPRDLALSLRSIVEGVPGRDAIVVYGPGHLGSDGIDNTPTRRPFTTTLMSSFGDDPDVLSWGQVIIQEQDKLARANHKAYLEEVGLPSNDADKPASRHWPNLSEHYRASNRSFVDHLDAKLDLLGCGLAAGTSGRPVIFTQVELNLLARAEHNRWVAERLLSGWRPGLVRNEREKHHPDLVPWEALSEDVQAYDLALVRALPSLVARGGKRIARVTAIGVTGHRDITINKTNRKLMRAIDEALDSIKAEHPDDIFTIYSPLAEGADRLVAERAMARISAGLIVPLPLPLGDYRQDFMRADGADAANGHRASLVAFQTLLDRCDDVFELPLMVPPQAEDYRTHHYAALGAWLIRTCDHIIGIWDGSPAAGPGGTGDVMNWAQGAAIPEAVDRPEVGPRKVKAHIVPFERGSG